MGFVCFYYWYTLTINLYISLMTKILHIEYRFLGDILFKKMDNVCKCVFVIHKNVRMFERNIDKYVMISYILTT